MVFSDRNSRAPASRFVSPEATTNATCSSRGESSSWEGPPRRGRRRAPLAPISSRAWRAGLGAEVLEGRERPLELAAGLGAPADPAKAEAVGKLRPGPLEGRRSERVQGQRLAEVAVDVVVDQATAPAGDRRRPRSATSVGLLGEGGKGPAGLVGSAQADVGLDEVGLPRECLRLREASLSAEALDEFESDQRLSGLFHEE